MPALQELVDAIGEYRFSYVTEDELQRGLATALTSAGHDVEREVRLDSHSRIDLLVDRVGIEVKVADKADAVLRQLHRYAASERIESLVLVTSRVRHAMPPSIDGKPLTVVQLAAGAL